MSHKKFTVGVLSELLLSEVKEFPGIWGILGGHDVHKLTGVARIPD